MEKEQYKELYDCDLIMKGGIASGLVYPAAILELKEDYRLRSIGGASAGAIAATAAAAAEYGRQTGASGFDGLSDLNKELQKEGQLRGLFQESANTSLLMETFLKGFACWTQALKEKSDKISANLMKSLGQAIISLWAADDLKKSTPASPKQENAVKRFQEIFDYINESFQHSSRSGKKSFTFAGNITGLLLSLKGLLLPGQIPLKVQGAILGVFLALGLEFMFLALLLSVGLMASFIFPVLLTFLTRENFIYTYAFCAVVAIIAGWQAGKRFNIALGLEALGLVKTIIIPRLVEFKAILFKHLPENSFGMCKGHSENATKPALTDWFHNQLQKMSGRSKPLTFGDLKEKDIELQMITSNISQCQPYKLPFDKDLLFIFNKDEFAELFPAEIVEHLINNSQRPPSEDFDLTNLVDDNGSRVPDKYYYLPERDKLPVLLGMRLSLSFPILLSAVPLYTVSQATIKRKLNEERSPIKVSELQKNWFSDGGISSNFPIHFFDKWLPTYPTFGIDLTSLPPETVRTGKLEPANTVMTGNYQQIINECKSKRASIDPLQELVYLPKPEDLPAPELVNFDTSQNNENGTLEPLIGFFSAIISTMQNYHDNSQAMLPGYRERIVQIRLNKYEGGLNLEMDKELVESMDKKGRLAGKKLINDFDFKEHQWIRYLALMPKLEEQLMQLTEALKKDNATAKLKEYQLIPLPHSYYQRKEAWCQTGQQRMESLKQLIQEWHKMDDSLPFFNKELPADGDEKLPTPLPVLRTTPEL
jgi:predicted acylesterase/phospholipase RssA